MNTQHAQPVNKELLFEVQLNWLSKQKGVLWADDVDGTLHVATPVAFGGEGNEWSPEHLFLSSISSCFMTTFLVFAKKFQFDISRFECTASGKVELVEGRFQFTRVIIFPKIYVTDETKLEKAHTALQKAEKYCLIANSLKTEVICQGMILQTPQPQYSIQ
ncbi:MAG TPA: OsmC family protein [Chitinophagaceae bacterium]